MNTLLFKPTFPTVKIFQLLCAIYVIVVTFSNPPVGARDPITGNVIGVNSTGKSQS